MTKSFRLIFSAYLSVFLFLAAPGLQNARAEGAAQPPVNGKHEVRYPSGRLMEKGRYKNGKKQGTWLFYDEKGMMTKKEKWKDDRLQWEAFFEEGRMRRIIDKNGKVIERPACGC